MRRYSSPLLYSTSKFLVKSFSWLFLRTQIIKDAPLPPPPFILASNHISHFDPPLLVLSLKEQIDFMAMRDLFNKKIASWWLRNVGTFPVNREETDAKAAREAIHRLKAGRIVVIYPERGIRTGKESVLEGACLGNDIATLAYLARCPIVPSIIIGSDQLYAYKKLWRRPKILIRMGIALNMPTEVKDKDEIIAIWTSRLSRSMRDLYETSQHQNLITPQMIPRSAQERWKT
jgi:1-acyl-sn-glycerol-3-phosphate acyltransferase